MLGTDKCVLFLWLLVLQQPSSLFRMGGGERGEGNVLPFSVHFTEQISLN